VIQRPLPLTDPLEAWVELDWPGAWFVRGAAASGRLAVLLAASLGARSGHDYLGCEHLVAGAVRAGVVGEPGGARLSDVSVVAIAASQRLAEVRPEQVEAWFADPGAADPEAALHRLRILPTVTPRAASALRRARAAAASAAAVDGATAMHVLHGVLEDPGIVAPAADSLGVSLEPARRWARSRAAWGPVLDLLDELPA
jgi:hypothetical protein